MNNEDSGTCGDLSQWEYLTKTYDHDTTFDDDSNFQTSKNTHIPLSNGTDSNSSMKTEIKEDKTNGMHLLSSGRSDMFHQRNEPMTFDQILNCQAGRYCQAEVVPIHEFTMDEVRMIDSSYLYNDQCFDYRHYPYSGSAVEAPSIISGQRETLKRHSWSYPMLDVAFYQPCGPTKPPWFMNQLSQRQTIHTSDCISPELSLTSQPFVALNEPPMQMPPSTVHDSQYPLYQPIPLLNALNLDPIKYQYHQPAGSVATTSAVASADDTKKTSQLKNPKRQSNKSESNTHRTKNSSEALLISVQELLDTPEMSPYKNKIRLLLPLSPYNYYYRDERDNIVLGMTNDGDKSLPLPVSDFSDAKLQQLLHQHWFVDPTKQKRVHRKSHGKMEFERLSKLIATRWHNLPREGRDFYRRVARMDEVYYHQQLKERQKIQKKLSPAQNSVNEYEQTLHV